VRLRVHTITTTTCGSEKEGGTMNIREREDGTFETIELPQDAWQVLRLGFHQ